MKTSIGLHRVWSRRAVAVVSTVSLLAAPLGASAGERRHGGRDRQWQEDRDEGRRSSGGQSRPWDGGYGRGPERHQGGYSGGYQGYPERRHDSRGWSRPPSEWRAPRPYGTGWRFQPRYGWCYEVRPGYWSPFYTWWWFAGQTMLAMAPTVTVIRYSTGYYALQGDGFTTPYYWVWVPAVSVVAPPPPPPAPMAAPEVTVVQPAPPAPYVGQTSSGGRAAAGTIIGGAVGGVLGSTVGGGQGRIAGVIVGTLLGALVGHDIGRSLDQADELHAAYVLEKNKTGQGASWVNPDSGAEVSVVPTRTYQDQTGQYCREYQTEVVVGGERQKAYGTACRMPDGQWKIVN